MATSDSHTCNGLEIVSLARSPPELAAVIRCLGYLRAVIWLWIPIPLAWLAIAGLLSHTYLLDIRSIEEEEYEVHSAYLASQMCAEKPEGDCEEYPLVIRAKSDVFSFVATPRRFVMLFVGVVPVSGWIQTDYLYRNLVAPAWQPSFKIPGKYRLVGETEIAAYYKYGVTVFPDSMGYIEFSRVGFSLDLKTAFFRFDHNCGLCGGGRLVTMRKTDGAWRVVSEKWLWVG